MGQPLVFLIVTIHPEFFILGHFNLHLDTLSTATSTFNDILATFNLKQHVFPPYTLMVTDLVSS